MSTKGLPNTPAAQALTKVLESGIAPEKLDQVYDLLKLMGLVLGHSTLLAVATDVTAEAAARVSAARALINIKEDPQVIGERIRRSTFADLSVDKLKSIVRQLEAGDRDLTSLLKEQSDGTAPSP
jgi:hypothetical protein